MKILSLEAKDIYGAMHYHGVNTVGYSVRGSDGSLSLRKFTSVFDDSLDLSKACELYEKITRRKDMSFSKGKHVYTQAFINVTFKYDYKLFNKAGKNTFIRAGYTYRDCSFTDCVCVKDGQLIGIVLNQEVVTPLPKETLESCFVFEDGKYIQKGEPVCIKDRAALRRELYENGFMCDGIYYVRYKRSGGSSRVGKCLFVNNILAERMSKWDKCGIKLNEGDAVDLAAWEAYISLPMSSTIDTVEIAPENILVIDDYDSVFTDSAVAVGIVDGKLHAEEKDVEVSNSIWDGQSLMDKSLFGPYKDKGMLLLRNRFFKTCAFNTNIQQYFKDNNITDVSQLNGFTVAKKIEDIKLITTKSSIKYTKFGEVHQWMSNIDNTYGIVKFEKPTHYFDGRMVQSHYQLLNTLPLTPEEVHEILQPSLDYITKVRTDPDILRYHISYPGETEITAPLTSKNEIVFKLLGINDEFAKTKLYYDFRNDIVKAFMRNLKQGHILLQGNYSTLFGNGLEMLQQSIGKFRGGSTIGQGRVICKNFAPDTELLGSRSPHITMGNICLFKNISNEDYNRYFNLTNEIVCINAIEENIQQRCNGCDYDSDTIMLTDNAVLINAAKKYYHKLKVPTSIVTAKKSERHYTSADKADLDIRTSVNKIGEIVNLSQQLNSIFWHNINSGQSVDDNMELYYDICKLAVLSGIEIDKAKKEFIINSNNEIAILRDKYKITEKNKAVKPNFFKTITLENGYKLSQTISYKYFKTAMDYLQKEIASYNFRKSREPKLSLSPLSNIIKYCPPVSSKGFYYNKKEQVIEDVRRYKREIAALYVNYSLKSKDERAEIRQQGRLLRQECIERVDNMISGEPTMYLLLKAIEKPCNSDVSKFLFDILFSTPNHVFFDLINKSKEDLFELIECQNGGIKLYDFTFFKQKIKKK